MTDFEKDALVIQTQMDGKGKAIKELLSRLMITIDNNSTYHLRLDILESKTRQKNINEKYNDKKPIPMSPRISTTTDGRYYG